MERNNTGRSEIMPLFEGLADTEHLLTLEVSNEPANPWVKGHTVQIFALLSASDSIDGCKGNHGRLVGAEQRDNGGREEIQLDQ